MRIAAAAEPSANKNVTRSRTCSHTRFCYFCCFLQEPISDAIVGHSTCMSKVVFLCNLLIAGDPKNDLRTVMEDKDSSQIHKIHVQILIPKIANIQYHPKTILELLHPPTHPPTTARGSQGGAAAGIHNLLIVKLKLFVKILQVLIAK